MRLVALSLPFQQQQGTGSHLIGISQTFSIHLCLKQYRWATLREVKAFEMTVRT